MILTQIDLERLSHIVTMQDILWLLGVFAAGISTIIQTLSKKYKPWSWLAIQIGRAVNKEVIDSLKDVKEKVDCLEMRCGQMECETEKNKALAARRRILRFADECRRNEKHSEEYFNNILEDISFYKDYCDNNPKFENDKAVIASEIIEDVYRKTYKTNSFL